MRIVSRCLMPFVVTLGILTNESALLGQPTLEPFSLGVFAGPAIPSLGVSSVYAALDTAGPASAYTHASSLGFHAGARARFGLSQSLSFSGGACLVRFASQDQSATLEDGSTLTLQTATTLVPISAGVTAFVFRGIISPYVTVEATYTYRSVTASSGDSPLRDLIIESYKGIDLEPTTSRIGALAAAGVQLDIGGLQPFVELRYHWTNLVSTSPYEEPISFLNVSLGLLF